MVDTISSLASIDYRHDEWGVDVTVGGSQKGLMLPPGLSLQRGQRQGARGLEDGAAAAVVFWAWDEMMRRQQEGLSSPTRPRPTCCYGLPRSRSTCCTRRASTTSSPATTAHAEATRRAVRAWGLEIQCRNPGEYSSSLTAVLLPEGHNADGSAGPRSSSASTCRSATASGKLAGKVFRIGHLGDFNDLMVIGTLAGVEMGLKARGIPHRSGGVEAAMTYLAGNTGALAAAAE